MKLLTALMGIMVAAIPPHAASLQSSAGTAPPWHVSGNPAIISQEVQFTNAGAN
jgi:hypothetical protein